MATCQKPSNSLKYGDGNRDFEDGLLGDLCFLKHILEYFFEYIKKNLF